MKVGINRLFYVLKLIEKIGVMEGLSLVDEDEEVVIWFVVSLYGVVVDIMVIMFILFMLVMIMFLEVQQKVQDEIDCVIGSD